MSVGIVGNNINCWKSKYKKDMSSKSNHIDKTIDDNIIERIEEYNKVITPSSSVIVVTYNTNEELLLKNLNSLKEQSIDTFELIIIDNSDKKDLTPIFSEYVNKYIKLKKNYGLSIARNVGIKFSSGDIVIFLDDDAVPAENFVEQHEIAHKELKIIGLRGKSMPLTNSKYNFFAKNYDLGDEIIPCYINLEGNSSFKRLELLEMRGFNPMLEKAGGHEGLEISYRIFKKFKTKDVLIYYPDAIIFHDYSTSFKMYLTKRLRHSDYKSKLKRQSPEIFNFSKMFKTSPRAPNGFQKPSILIKIIPIQLTVFFILFLYVVKRKVIK